MSKSKAFKIFLGFVCVALFVMGAFAAVYFLNQPNSQLHSEPAVVTNFSDGSWLNTKIVSYDDTGTTIDGEGYQNSTVTSGTYDGKACWVLAENYTFAYTNGTMREDFVTYYIEQSTYSNLHLSHKRLVDGVLQFNEEYGPESEGFDDDLSVYGNMTVSVVSEKVQVPAGSFNTTVRTALEDPESGLYYSVWMSEDVPAWGIVKSRFYVGNLTLTEYMLESYGR
ncbi:MAG: hypothetical protein ACQCN4_02030 [Candidatus Bathyarchaeia archaeon]|jgi:hypothetical protein